MKKYVELSGICPTQNCEYEITVTYASVHSIGGNASYRKIDADCYYASKYPCQHANSCPLFASAANVIN